VAEVTFDEFVCLRLPSLLRVAKALCVDHGTAEDVVQEVLLRVYERWDAIAVLDQPDAYVRRMIVNEYLSWRRKWARITTARDLVVDVAAVADPEKTATDRVQLAGEIARLPARQRVVLVLRYVAGLSDTEIADELGCSAGTVRSHASRALATLRIRIDRVEGMESHGDRLAH
jgi:RNA polymerase sigma-70 factor (sigma-E family)